MLENGEGKVVRRHAVLHQQLAEYLARARSGAMCACVMR